MKIEIDQSGKVEDTARLTVLAYTNGTQYTVMLSSSSKRKLQEIYRRIGMPRIYIYHIFAVAVFILIRRLQELSSITIDTEYPGKDEIIATIVHKLLSLHKLPEHNIQFARIGSHPRVHYAAKSVFDKKVKADYLINAEEIINLLKKTDEHLRECLSTLVDARLQSYHHYTNKHLRVKRKKN